MWLCGSKPLFFLFWDRIWECSCLDLRDIPIPTYLIYIKPNGFIHGVVIYTSLPSLYSTYKYKHTIRDWWCRELLLIFPLGIIKPKILPPDVSIYSINLSTYVSIYFTIVKYCPCAFQEGIRHLTKMSWAILSQLRYNITFPRGVIYSNGMCFLLFIIHVLCRLFGYRQLMGERASADCEWTARASSLMCNLTTELGQKKDTKDVSVDKRILILSFQ